MYLGWYSQRPSYAPRLWKFSLTVCPNPGCGVDVPVGRYPLQVSPAAHVADGPVTATVEAEVEVGGLTCPSVQGPVGRVAAEQSWPGKWVTREYISHTKHIGKN